MPHSYAVSVVIPTRDCLQYLPKAIASIGTAADVEIIVFDDGSSDGSTAWLAQQARRDSRLRVLRGEGVGPSMARNLAIDAASAPLIAFLDADDVWYPQKLAVQMALHRRWPEVVLSFTDYRHVTVEGEDRGGCFAFWPRFRAQTAGAREPFLLGGDAIAQIYAENVIGTSTVIARTDVLRELGGFACDLLSSEDWDLWLRLAARGQVACVPQVLADYLMHRPGNVTRNLRARMTAVRIIADRHAAKVRRFGYWPVNTLEARLLGGRADAAQAAGLKWRAAGLRLMSLLRAPDRRTAREVVSSLRGLLAA